MKINLQKQFEYFHYAKNKIKIQNFLLDKHKEILYFQEEIKILLKYLDGIQFFNQKDLNKHLHKWKNNKKIKFPIDIDQFKNSKNI